MRPLAALSSKDLVELAESSEPRSPSLVEIEFELMQRRSRAAKAALSTVRNIRRETETEICQNLITDWFDEADKANRCLQAIWSPNASASEQTLGLFLQLGATGWSIAFTATFKKAVAGVDKKTQGRIMTAISDLSEDPLGTRGDTIAPLRAVFKGLWRYRIGDYRIIYEPRKTEQQVLLIDFAARGGAYSDA
jgi:mRNA interferase RelE/StbE